MADTSDKKNGKSKAVNRSRAANRQAIAADTLPTAEELKEHFKTGDLPLEKDYNHIIELASFGHQAISDDGPEWGLILNEQGKLSWDFSKLFCLSYDLTPDAANQHIVLNKYYLTGTDDDNHQLALLALNPAIGPTEAVNSKAEETTIFTLPAVKTTSSGERSSTTVNIIASKSIGQTAPLLPFEYIDTSTTKYSLWYTFNLDTSTEDFTDCALIIEPLTLIVRRIKNFASDSAGEIISLITFSFSWTDYRQMLPSGAIYMFSGSKVPAGWALCDGTNGTPDLTDKFILAGNLKESGKTNDIQVDKYSSAWEIKQSTDYSSFDVNVTIQGHAVTIEELPSHHHRQGDPYLYNFDFEFGFYSLSGDYAYISAGTTSGHDNDRKAPYTEVIGNDASHTHTATADKSDTSHKHSVDTMPSWYVLAFIMKL